MNARIPIVIDSREKAPYAFDRTRYVVERRALAAGDYSLVGAEDRVAVERKSLDDFVSTVIHARDRFHEELRKLVTYDFACIVVEASVRDIIERRYTGGAHPSSVLGAAMSISVNWRLPVHFYGDRQMACLCVGEILERCHAKMNVKR